MPMEDVPKGYEAVVWFVRRYRQPAVAPVAALPVQPDEALGKYRDQIERDLARLD